MTDEWAERIGKVVTVWAFCMAACVMIALTFVMLGLVAYILSMVFS